jgi:hypothetical protein
MGPSLGPTLSRADGSSRLSTGVLANREQEEPGGIAVGATHGPYAPNWHICARRHAEAGSFGDVPAVTPCRRENWHTDRPETRDQAVARAASTAGHVESAAIFVMSATRWGPIFDSASIWVLLIRRRMLCSSRWVIPGLAEGVAGWLAGQRVAGGSRSSGGCRHRVKNGRR